MLKQNINKYFTSWTSPGFMKVSPAKLLSFFFIQFKPNSLKTAILELYGI